ncbi:IS66 family insertion sequence element accessory protein TnpA [Lentibacillus juripiscarius]|uniref:IS66 family insertion sequence element accessory protein TnpA n=1 Tax=Lentibacillus juripiscarius TaxID=257446 RepID=UPI0036D24250
MTLKDKRIEWKARYDAWKESGLSVAEWCRNQEIKIHQMYYWVQRFENSGNGANTMARRPSRRRNHSS